jgi:hypothetical protein
MSEAIVAQPPLMAGMALGGVVISALGAGSTVFVEEKKPSFKSLARDFIIGAIMVALIIQLLPESATTVIQFALSLAPLSLFQSGGGAAGATWSLPQALSGGATGASEEEVKVGVPSF